MGIPAHMRVRLAAGFALALLFAGMPFVASAQDGGDEDLDAAIRAAILSDPRTNEMTEEEIAHMVAALSEEAQAQGVTPHDILWRPQEIPEGEYVVPEEACTNMLCALSSAFGLDGSDIAMPIMLGIISAVLLFVIGAMLHHRYKRHPVVGVYPTTQAPQNPPQTTTFDNSN